MAEKKPDINVLAQLDIKTKNVSKRRDSVVRTDATDIVRKSISSNDKQDVLQYRNGNFLGIVLRVEPDSDGALGTLTNNLFTTLGFDPPFKKRVRVYSTFFHGCFPCPIPNGDTTGENAAKIESLPNSLFEAESDDANSASYKPGDIVVISFKNLYPLAGPTLIGPYSNATHAYNSTDPDLQSQFAEESVRLAELAGGASSLAANCEDAAPGFEDFRQPCSGKVGSPFGNRPCPVDYPPYKKGDLQMHPGIDIGQDSGLPVVSSFDGEVVCVVADGTFHSKPVIPKTTKYCYIFIKHFIEGKWYLTSYFHLNRTFVGTGDKVTRGQEIGSSGGAVGEVGSGGTTGSHLHYEFYTAEKEPKTGGDPRSGRPGNFKFGNQSPIGLQVIDSKPYTGWSTGRGSIYIRNSSCLSKSNQEAIATGQLKNNKQDIGVSSPEQTIAEILQTTDPRGGVLLSSESSEDSLSFNEIVGTPG